MTTQIPVICETPGCGAVWFSPSLISISPGSSIHLMGARVVPCPGCKGTGKIPDGIYTGVSAKLFNPVEYNLVLKALKRLHERVKAGASEEEIKAEINKSWPFLSALSAYIPKNPKDICAYIVTLIAILHYFSNEAPDKQAPEVLAETNVSQALSKVSGDLKTNPPNTQQQQKEGPQKQTEKK